MTLRLGLAGAGHMGANHARKIQQLAKEDGGLVLAGVVDPHRERAEALCQECGGSPHAELPELLAGIDALVVAVPTVAHYPVVDAALEAGCDVLVEKPIAASIEEAEKLIGRSKELGRLLQVGHLEWFNAAMRRIEGHLTRPRFVEAHRLGPFAGRATDVDVVRDLMIHDLDIVQRLVGEEPASLESIGVPVISPEVDIANARLRFPGGCVANFTASRVSPTPMRKIRFFQPDGYFSIDFLEQKALIARRGEPDEKGERKIEVEPLEIDRSDALLSQLRSFVVAVRERSEPVGAADDGLAALRTALRIREAMPPLEELQ
ncbi:MAG: Gfo/Idh/MocA family oxidoreductase [Myxococcota bacterium]|nr:Gfo/Idh/MocA family oxidoreductase [Myxococcota bacterium]